MQHRSKWHWLVAGALAASCSLVGSAVAQVTVPNLGPFPADVSSVIDKLDGWEHGHEVVEVVTDHEGERVARQHPTAGSTINPGQAIHLVLADVGEEWSTVEVLLVVGQTLTIAILVFLIMIGRRPPELPGSRPEIPNGPGPGPIDTP